ncbi:MAG: hypothetical protein WD022_00645 [Balneolaceae bacterium]
MNNSEKSITLTPSWKAFFWRYLIGILLIPVLIGIYLLWKTRNIHKSISYIITDRKITVVEGNYSQNIDLADIRQVAAGDTHFGVGSISLKTQGRTIELIGLKNPDGIANSIEKAVEAELRRLQTSKQTTVSEIKYDPGTMDRLDYLTGLWQQGLLSEEDFKAEREKLL